MGINIFTISISVVALSALYLQFYGIFGSISLVAIRIFFACIGGIICGFVAVLKHSKYRKVNADLSTLLRG